MGLDRTGHHHWRAIGREADVLHQQLQIAAVDDTIAVCVQRVAITCATAHSAGASGDQHGVRAVGLAIAICIAGDEQAQAVVAARGGANVDALEPLTVELVERKRAVALQRRAHRAQARQDRNRRHQTVAALDDQAQIDRTTGRGVELRLAQREAVVRALAGAQAGADRMGQVAERRSQVRRHGLLLHTGRAVAEQCATGAAGEHLQAPENAFLVTVAHRLRGLQVAHRTQPALRVVAVQELATVARHDALDGAVMVERKLHRLAAAGHQAAVAHCDVHTVGESDLADLAVGDAVARTVRCDQDVVGAIARSRVVAATADQVIVARPGALHYYRGRFEPPAGVAFGHKGRQIPGLARNAVLFTRKGERHAAGVGQRQNNPLSLLESTQNAGLFAPGESNVGLQIHIAESETPALAEAAGDRAAEGIVDPGERQLVPAQIDMEVRFRSHQPAFLGRRVDLQIDAGFTTPSAEVQHLESQGVKAVGQGPRVELHQSGVVHRNGAAGEQAVVRVAIAGDLERPAIDVGLAGAGNDVGRRADARKRQLAGERRRRRRLVERVAHPNRRCGAADKTIHIGGFGAQCNLADAGRGDPGAAVRVQRQLGAVGEQAQSGDGAKAFGDHMHQHLLSRDDREAGRVFDDHAGRRRRQRGADDQRRGGAAESVRDARHDQVLPDLSGARCPSDHTGCRVQRRTFRQAGGAVAQHGVLVRILAEHLELERAPEQRHVVRDRKHRCAVDIGDRQADGTL